ncbi:hypothetical protein OG21DRAFT_1488548 [Imleria badia]|nr:hypothetical protein OG21DRAFT_1488548 [Imleria badia]
MRAGPSDAEIDEAEAAIKTEQSYQASKGERTLNVIGALCPTSTKCSDYIELAGDNVVAVSSSGPVSIVQSTMPVASAAFSVVKDRVNHFVENSKMLMNALDEVGKVHPFIQVFKVGIQLEITRRQNDEKVLALNSMMCDMMSALVLLKKFGSPKERALQIDGPTIEERLQERMDLIIESIKSCAKLCDSYQRRHIAVKFFTSIKWQQKFTGVAEQFADHQDAIQSDLQIYISVEITNTNEMLWTLGKNMTSMMEMVFDHMQSPKERELANFVQSKGGVATSPDDKLLKEVILNFQQQQQQKKKNEDKKPVKGSPESDFPVDLSSFKEELNKEIDTVLAANGKVFERAFEAIEISQREVKGTIVHESDRVIETILAGVNHGPQERILDKDLYHIWKEMGWRGSVKATHFVMAINDHFSAKLNVAINEIQMIANEPNPKSPTENLRNIASIAQLAIPATPAEDLWTLRYITVHRAQPLIEALDDDGSSFITVNEVNAFTSSRPQGWSLPRWIAYWTMGFEMTTRWYYRRIRRLFSLLSDSSKDVLPANRKVVSQFMRSWSIHATEDLLAGCRDVSDWDGTDWADHSIFLKFKSWVLENEGRMNKVLRTLVYYIDQDNTLNTVTGGGRPETVSVTGGYVSRDVTHAIRDRVEKLQAIYKLQNIKKEEKLQTIFFGLYAYTFEIPKKGEFWMQDPHRYDTIPDEPPDDLDVPEPELFYEPQIEELDLDADSTKNTDPELPASNADQEEPVPVAQASQSLIGAWSGTYDYTLQPRSDVGLVSFLITQHTSDDQFCCSGVDTWGPFTVNGRVNGEHITFLKEYAEPRSGRNVSWLCEGLLNEEKDNISGNWGPPPSHDIEPHALDRDNGDVQAEPEEQEEMAKQQQDDETVDHTPPTINIELVPSKEEADEEDMTREDCVSEAGSALTNFTDATEMFTSYGSFVLYRRSVECTYCRPSDEEFEENKARALWRLVRKVAKFQFQTRHLTWEGIRERRDKRQMYLELWQKKSEYYGATFANTADESKWTELVRTVRPSDLHLWNRIARFKDRRNPVHVGINCDHCGISELKPTRITCLECSEERFYYTVDLCSNCQTETVYRKRDNKDHNPSHPMLQLRWVAMRIEIDSVMLHAKSRLVALSEKDDKHCTHCKKELPERLYWYCTQCEDDTFVCIECNNHFEKEMPWLLERKAGPEQLHHWLHPMVLKPQAVEKSNPSLSTDERLAKLEAKLDKQVERTQAHEASVTARLHKLEELLEQVISVVKQVT